MRLVPVIARFYGITINEVGMTQKQLSETTGFYQGDISKIERGLSNPSVITLKRLAEGLGAELNIEFVFKG